MASPMVVRHTGGLEEIEIVGHIIDEVVRHTGGLEGNGSD